MKDSYYKLPLKFGALFNRRELPKTTLEESIAQYINMVATSSFGECKFDDTLGCEFWDTDFDLLTDAQSLKNHITKSITETVRKYESRLKLTQVNVGITSHNLGTGQSQVIRMKKRVSVEINGFIIKTNRPFLFQGYFYIAPLSYL